jgi:hypothetical protein
VIRMVFSDNYAPAFSSFIIGNGQEQQKANGRLDLLSSLPLMDIPQYQHKSISNQSYKAEAVAGILERSPVSDLYFSEENIDALQHGIRYRVWKETNEQYVIGRQSDTELKIIMRAIFLQYGQLRQGVDCVTQVRDLNAKVLEWAVPEVLSNLKQYETYRRDISTMPVPLERAQLSTQKGTRVLEIKSFI